MATLLTLNTFLLDIRLFGLVRVYPAAPHIEARVKALPDALRTVDADVVCLQEVFRKPHRAHLAGTLRDLYPYCAGLTQPGLPLGTGLMVLSKTPITAPEIVEFKCAYPEERLAIRMGLIDCSIGMGSLGTCRIVDLHLAATGLTGHPEDARACAIRRGQIEELLARLGAAPGVTICAGDFNAGPEAAPVNYRQMIDAGFADVVAGAGGDAAPARTWDPANPLITGANAALPAQRIDHVFVRGGGIRVDTAGVVLDDFRVALAGGARVPVSDHYGVLVSLEAGG